MNVVYVLVGIVAILAGVFVATSVVSDIQLILASVLILGGLNLTKVVSND